MFATRGRDCTSNPESIQSQQCSVLEGPRDIDIEFADLRTKKAVMNAAKQGGGLKFNDAMIQLFPDLPPETLQQKKLLCPFSQRLMDADIHYHLSPVGNLSVHHNGKRLVAFDFDSGVTLLRALNLDLTKHIEFLTSLHKRTFSPKIYAQLLIERQKLEAIEINNIKNNLQFLKQKYC